MPGNTPAANKTDGVQTLQNVIPGLSGMTSQATSNITNLLSGNASPSLARTTNAFWGVGAGQPATSDINSFIGQRGTDLYGQQSQANQQTGLGNLLSLIQGYSGNVGTSASEQQQNNQFGASQAQQAGQFAQQQAMAEFQAKVDALSKLGSLANTNAFNF